jgi:hypothetical protein
VLAPSAGLDPALTSRADGLRAEGRQDVYGFVLLRAPLTEALARKLAGLGVALLGPHDDHHKARLPVASLHAVAALPEVEWVGVSAREQKWSAELSELRGSSARPAVVDADTPIPIVINLFEGDEHGSFRRQLEAAGAALGEYDGGLRLYRAVATGPVIERIVALDFVLFVELIRPVSPGLDESAPLVDADMIRPGTISYGLTRFGGGPIPVGIMDSGFAIGAGGHMDLENKAGCGLNFTTDAAGAFVDELGHGSHVLGILAGTGAANNRYRGVAPGVGESGLGSIRAAKVFTRDAKGSTVWLETAMNWMALPGQCGLPVPRVINFSGGFTDPNKVPLTGTDSTSRKLDYHVWNDRQLYVVSAGNEGPAARTIRSPGVAKNALTVGSVRDYEYAPLEPGLTIGDIAPSSSRGPTGDGRMKPNVVAPGMWVRSAYPFTPT